MLSMKNIGEQNEQLNRITVDKFDSFLKKAKKRWDDANTLDEKQRFIVWLISKVTITNENITAYINYDTITNRLCDFHIEVDIIERDKIMKLWRVYWTKDMVYES